MLQAEIITARAVEYPVCARGIPPIELAEGRYVVRFARTSEELDAALKLRFEVFNLELGEGLESSFQTGRDSDEFDEFCHHLIVVDTHDERIVGTYRMQTGEMAARKGFYSAGEFDLSGLPPDALSDAVELGRACIARPHRNTQALFLMWKGIAAYVAYNRKRYLFGCCSLTTQDEREGMRVFDMLAKGGHLHAELHATPRPGFECRASGPAAPYGREPGIPKLFRTYLRFGARVCGPPAIDRSFKTVDFLVIFDIGRMDAQSRRIFFGT
jgi:putative hemolysin